MYDLISQIIGAPSDSNEFILKAACCVVVISFAFILRALFKIFDI